MDCAITNPQLLEALVQDGQPCGRSYQGRFVQAEGCPHCAYVRFPAPDDQLLNNFYQIDYPKSSVDWYNLSSDYAPWKAPVRATRIADIAHRFGLGKGIEIHEFGCAFGGTVQALNDMGYRATGTELNQQAVDEGRSYGNSSIFSQDTVSFLQSSSNKPQVVFSYHAIEHFIDPFSFLVGIRDGLSQEGIIILVAPSSAAKYSLVYGLMRYMWFGYPEHLHLFSPGSAPKLADRIGMDLLEVSTSEFGLYPEATKVALLQQSPAAWALRAGNSALMGEELTMVFAHPESTIAKERSHISKAVRTMCDSFSAIEKAAMTANKQRLVDPASIEPIVNELLA